MTDEKMREDLGWPGRLGRVWRGLGRGQRYATGYGIIAVTLAIVLAVTALVPGAPERTTTPASRTAPSQPVETTATEALCSYTSGLAAGMWEWQPRRGRAIGDSCIEPDGLGRGTITAVR